MRISYRWLQEFTDIEDIGVAEVAETLTMLGIEVEAAYDLGALSKKIVIAEIKAIQDHPNADNLVICKVDAGEHGTVDVVCGATNIKPGDKVPLALPGAMFPDGTVLKKAKIRGIESNGMLCSGPELLWNDDQGGILILPEDFPVAEPFDALLEITITPNRPDCLSMVGIARELSAWYHRPLHVPTPRFNEITTPSENAARISVSAWEGCPRYTARVIRHMEVKPSPPWLIHKLESAGLRSVNNVVDATNLVLLECGHPLHAFDLDKIASHQIIVRWAEDKETIETLDGEKHTLTKNDLVIADPTKVVALAGIMGCGNSEISDSTVNLLLECAYFDPTTIRRTAKRHDMQTEASYRFERGTDREKMTVALERATQLIKKLAGGEVLKDYIDVFIPAPRQQPVSVNIDKVTSLLGIDLTSREIADNLARLGFELVSFDRERLSFYVPTHRVDISRDVDLVEEVARNYGYDKIPAVLPYMQSVPAEYSKAYRIETELRESMLGAGYRETINYSFISKKQLESLGFGIDSVMDVMNPISSEQDVMRPTLIPGIVNNLVHNLKHDIYDQRLFEIGPSYHRDAKADDGYTEIPWLVAGLTGSIGGTWLEEERDVTFYDMKGLAEHVLKELGITRYDIRPAESVNWLHPGKSAQFVRGDTVLCTFGEFHPALNRYFEIEERVYLLETCLDTLEQYATLTPSYQEIPRFPASQRDFAFLVDENVTAQEIERVIYSVGKELIENIELFDLYRGKQVPDGKKSLAYRVQLRARNKTLTDNEMNDWQTRVINELKKQLGISLR